MNKIKIFTTLLLSICMPLNLSAEDTSTPKEHETDVAKIINKTYEDYNTNGVGGAICNRIASTIENSSFINNKTTVVGGAVYTKGKTTVTDSNFNNNSAGSGGAVYNGLEFTTKGNTSFSGNTGASGGAIFNEGTLYFKDNTGFTKNIATNAGGVVYNEKEINIAGNTSFKENEAVQGGAIFNQGGTVNIDEAENVIFSGNSVKTTEDKDGGYGGAIANPNATIKITENSQNVLFENNTAIKITVEDKDYNGNGGAIANYGGNAKLEILGKNTVFNKNKADLFGGAIFNDQSKAVLNNLTLTANEAYNGGALYNSGTNGKLEMTASTLSGNISQNYGGAICNDNAALTITDTNFINNKAKYGGAVFTNSDITINAKNNNVIFSGNSADYGNDIYIDNAGSKLALNISEGKSIIFESGILGIYGYEITVNKSASSVSPASSISKTVPANTLESVVIKSTVENGKINVESGSLHLAEKSELKNTTVNIKTGATLNTINNQITSFNSEINFENNAKVMLDIDLNNNTADKFINVSSAVTISDINLLGIMTDDNLTLDLKELTGISTLNIDAGLKTQEKVILTPIRYLKSAIDDTGILKFSPTGKSYKDFNPAVMALPVAVIGGYLSQLNSYEHIFKNIDTFITNKKYKNTFIKTSESETKNDNMFNISKYNDNFVSISPYISSEKINLEDGPEVSGMQYGAFIGLDSEIYSLGESDWEGVFGLYAGYNGSKQDYNNVTIKQNGGTIGVINMIYKGNFFTGLTVNISGNMGTVESEGYRQYNKNEQFTMFAAGIAGKAGYNFEFKEGKYILQPSIQLDYSLVNIANYTNPADVYIESDLLNGVHVEPRLKFAGNLKNGWQPYAQIGISYTLIEDINVKANNTYLPKFKVKPYTKYGVGTDKIFSNNISGFAQAFIIKDGRDGFDIKAGIRIAI